MRGSWRIARVAGISIDVHWTLGVLLIYFALSFLAAGKGNPAVVVQGMTLMLAVFACIVLHELGHAFAARRYGIRTRDITLLPIGGMARLERMPTEPRQELVVALAGPAVSLLIAIAAGGVAFALGDWASLQSPEQAEQELTQVHLREGLAHFLASVAVFNGFIVLFNLLPAFPMDGGRVLRSTLAFWLPYPQATEIAAAIGRAMAVMFGIFGLFAGHWMLLLIALFIYIAGQAEAQLVQTKARFAGVPVRRAMISQFVAFTPYDNLGMAVDALLAGYQQDFPIVDHGQIVGLLTRADLVRSLASGGLNQSVRAIMRPSCATVRDADPLEAAFDRLQEEDCSTIPVVHEGELVGVLTLENIGEWVMVQTALDRPNE